MREEEEKEEAAEEEEIDNVIVFPGSRKDLHDVLPFGWHRVHMKLAPHVSHIIIIGASIIILVGAAAFGVHEGLVHHIAIAVIAERIASINAKG